MKSLRRLATQPVGLPFSADDVVEFHAARVLLLLLCCGTSGRRIDGLTKFAKLDFFARYPKFFEVARNASGLRQTSSQTPTADSDEQIESAMVRHHYGPWDKRYYHVLAHLESRQLISVVKDAKTYQIILTDQGLERAKAVAALSSFKPLVERMKEIKTTFGAKNGTYLKTLIYRVFDEEVGRRKLGEVIDL